MFFTNGVKTSADDIGEGIAFGTIQEENARWESEFLYKRVQMASEDVWGN